MASKARAYFDLLWRIEEEALSPDEAMTLDRLAFKQMCKQISYGCYRSIPLRKTCLRCWNYLDSASMCMNTTMCNKSTFNCSDNLVNKCTSSKYTLNKYVSFIGASREIGGSGAETHLKAT